jgi:hypothetical protein
VPAADDLPRGRTTEVPRGTSGYPEVPGVPRGTPGYPGVPRGTSELQLQMGAKRPPRGGWVEGGGRAMHGSFKKVQAHLFGKAAEAIGAEVYKGAALARQERREPAARAKCHPEHGWMCV